MKPFTYKKYKKLLNVIAAFGLLASLSGCVVAVPSALQLASFALDGASYATTGKTITDHVISSITAQDCAIIRLLDGEAICTDIPVEIAMLPDGTPAPNAGETARAMLNGTDDLAFQAAFQALGETEDEKIDQDEGDTYETASTQNSLL